MPVLRMRLAFASDSYKETGGGDGYAGGYKSEEEEQADHDDDEEAYDDQGYEEGYAVEGDAAEGYEVEHDDHDEHEDEYRRRSGNGTLLQEPTVASSPALTSLELEAVSEGVERTKQAPEVRALTLQSKERKLRQAFLSETRLIPRLKRSLAPATSSSFSSSTSSWRLTGTVSRAAVLLTATAHYRPTL